MLTRMRELTSDEWMKIFIENGGVVATDYRPAEAALDDHDLIDNGHVLTQDHPVVGKLAQRGPTRRASKSLPPNPVVRRTKRARTRDSVVPRSAPVLPVRESAKAPLAGVTVLEFATIIAAPLGVSFLGDLGARVIKVEPVGGDPYRGMGIHGIQAARTNQSKQSIALDLKTAEARTIVQKLVAKADVIIHNYRPGVPERLGIGYEDAKRLNPKIVDVSVNGYGPKGPGAHRPSTHPIPGAALGGALAQVGKGRPPGFCDTIEEVRLASEKLMRANEANPDPNTSMVVCSSAMLGLAAAKRHGVGQQISSTCSARTRTPTSTASSTTRASPHARSRTTISTAFRRPIASTRQPTIPGVSGGSRRMPSSRSSANSRTPNNLANDTRFCYGRGASIER